jgi:hypothetical protein
LPLSSGNERPVLKYRWRPCTPLANFIAVSNSQKPFVLSLPYSHLFNVPFVSLYRFFFLFCFALLRNGLFRVYASCDETTVSTSLLLPSAYTRSPRALYSLVSISSTRPPPSVPLFLSLPTEVQPSYPVRQHGARCLFNITGRTSTFICLFGFHSYCLLLPKFLIPTTW